MIWLFGQTASRCQPQSIMLSIYKSGIEIAGTASSRIFSRRNMHAQRHRSYVHRRTSEWHKMTMLGFDESSHHSLQEVVSECNSTDCIAFEIRHLRLQRAAVTIRTSMHNRCRCQHTNRLCSRDCGQRGSRAFEETREHVSRVVKEQLDGDVLCRSFYDFEIARFSKVNPYLSARRRS